jgi:hypothetical protein
MSKPTLQVQVDMLKAQVAALEMRVRDLTALEKRIARIEQPGLPGLGEYTGKVDYRAQMSIRAKLVQRFLAAHPQRRALPTKQELEDFAASLA